MSLETPVNNANLDHEQFFIRGLNAVVEIIDDLMAMDDLDDFYRLAVLLPRQRLGVERAGFSILSNDTLYGTFGTDMKGELVDERNVQYPLENTEWKTRHTFELRAGSRWFLREHSNHLEWTNKEKPLTGKLGWVVLTPILEGEKLLGFFSNDCAISGKPLDPNLQELLVVYCSLLSTLLQQKRTQSRLRQQMDRTSFILREIGDGLIVINENWIILDINSPMVQVIEKEPDSVVGTRLQDHVDRNSFPHEFFSHPQVPEQCPPRYELDIIRNDKSRVPCEITCVPYTKEGKRQIYLFCRDITERKHLEETREQLTQRLMEVQELERKEISSMLHDEFGQILTLIRLELQSINPVDDESKEHLDNCTQHIVHLLNSVRSMARSLRPSILDDLPIESALKDLLDGYKPGTSLRIKFIHDAHPDSSAVPKHVETALYRILQESMQNIMRHAEATSVKVSYENTSEGLFLSVQDDGIGMKEAHPSKPGIGLLGIRERLSKLQGTMKISSQKNKGTTIDFFIPHHEHTH